MVIYLVWNKWLKKVEKDCGGLAAMIGGRDVCRLSVSIGGRARVRELSERNGESERAEGGIRTPERIHKSTYITFVLYPTYLPSVNIK